MIGGGIWHDIDARWQSRRLQALPRRAQIIGTRETAMTNAVTAVPAAPMEAAAAHFAAGFTFETDCWDVHEAIASGDPGFVLLDVRDPAHYAAGQVAGATSLPHGTIIASRLRDWPEDTLFVTYCAGPHCNGAARGALRLARLGRKVKLMAGGITGWRDEGFELVTQASG
jgi:rhodanese-related sulfurtransferase